MRVTDYHSKGKGSPFAGSRVTIRTSAGVVVDVIDVPSWYGRAYLARHTRGELARRFARACSRARELEAQGG
jgi:hypothetical protein